jgi:hypothetical protein
VAPSTSRSDLLSCGTTSDRGPAVLPRVLQAKASSIAAGALGLRNVALSALGLRRVCVKRRYLSSSRRPHTVTAAGIPAESWVWTARHIVMNDAVVTNLTAVKHPDGFNVARPARPNRSRPSRQGSLPGLPLRWRIGATTSRVLMPPSSEGQLTQSGRSL